MATPTLNSADRQPIISATALLNGRHTNEEMQRYAFAGPLWTGDGKKFASKYKWACRPDAVQQPF